jgi:hypothetical protein
MMNPLRSAALALLALPLALAPACSTTPDPAYAVGDVPAASGQVLWEVVKLTLEEQDFPVAARGFDPVEKSVTSLWHISLHPFRGNGFRERVHLTYAAAGPGKVELSVRVEKQVNQNIAKPLNPEYADWKDEPDDEERARLVLARIQSRLGGGPVVLK